MTKFNPVTDRRKTAYNTILRYLCARDKSKFFPFASYSLLLVKHDSTPRFFHAHYVRGESAQPRPRIRAYLVAREVVKFFYTIRRVSHKICRWTGKFTSKLDNNTRVGETRTSLSDLSQITLSNDKIRTNRR